VVLDDHSFTPDKVSIAAGQEITITVTNKGTEEHEWVLFNLGQDAGEAFGDEDEGNIFWEVEVDPGAAITQTFIAPVEPGEYQIVCGTAGHYIAGMIGKLIVVADE